jgi:hypothetical protein
MFSGWRTGETLATTLTPLLYLPLPSDEASRQSSARRAAGPRLLVVLATEIFVRSMAGALDNGRIWRSTEVRAAGQYPTTKDELLVLHRL